MKYQISKNAIEMEGKEDFNPQHTLCCGQIFAYQMTPQGFVVFSKDKKAEIFENKSGFLIQTKDPQYFVRFFDLETDYAKIKKALSKHEILKNPVSYGSGIRILRQDLFETLISFIVSANNNIKRIQLILSRMREKFGSKTEDFFAFPTRQQLLKATQKDFEDLGAGYRAKYLFDVLRQVDEKTLEAWQSLPTEQLKGKLESLAGVGPKVADCVMLFAYARKDVFPVDTWIEKMYRQFFECPEKFSRKQIREALLQIFGDLAGYAQQYLFFSMREHSI